MLAHYLWRRPLATACALLVVFSASTPHVSRNLAGHLPSQWHMTAQWKIAGQLPAMRDRPAVATGRDGNVYVFGGMENTNGYNVFNTTYIYHPRTHTWTHGAAMAMAREGAQAVTLPDGRIVVLGGSPACPNSSVASMCVATNRVDVYNPRNNTWHSLKPMVTPRYRFNAVLYKGKIFAIGGLNGTTALSSVEAYDLHTRNWYAMPTLPQPTDGAAAVATMGRIFLMGGAPGALPIYNSLYVFDGTGWMQGPSMPHATQDYAAARGPDGKIYALGGWNQVSLTLVQVFDPVTGAWSMGPSLPGPRCCMGTTTTPDGTIYMIGGDSWAGSIAVLHPATSSTLV